MLAVLASVVSAALMFSAQTRLSPVNDEPANLPSGYVYLTTGRYVDATHPPLLRYILGLPFLVLRPSPLPDDDSALTDWHEFGRNFIFRNDTSWKAILWSSRAMSILLSMTCIALVYFWARRLWGAWPAFFGALFLAFEPTLMGHGALATLDMGAALAFFGTVAAYRRYRERPGTGRFAVFAAVFAAALATKFSTGVLLVAIPLAGICAGRIAAGPRLIKKAGIMLAAFVLIVGGAYGFGTSSMAEDPQITHHRKAGAITAGIDRVAEELGADRQALMNVRIPMYHLVKGLGLQAFHAAAQDRWEDADFYQYLNGEYSRNGWRSYYLWTFLLKSTVPTLLLVVSLVAAAFVAGFRRRREGRWWSEDPGAWPFLAVPPVLYFAVCSVATINIGHRYLLPVYPFVAMGVAWLFSLARARLARIALVSAVAWHVMAANTAWPHYLAYFNEAAGGTRDGYLHLVDSNVDWGQDLLYLKTDVSARKGEGASVFGDVFGTVKPADLGYDLPAPPDGPEGVVSDGPATVYLSVNRMMLRSRPHPAGLYPWLNGREPDRWVGASIAAFDFND